ncbi:hypothetical protein [Bradyrhizobium sp. CB3481]|uniref:hypothetical protein n=1 Tax=Bradyrhizobium sp. CB3481 TaxID=3039158 RepID=UPI0024B1C419|nr:hypothetical protein [Bradyrhizobium sp. CB3481]WFU18832.1 hypothetical protein QA643_11085 [Bradyrhizobium sp. CB3481]
MQFWLNGDPGGELDLPEGISGIISGASKQFASFEQDRPAADITIGALSLGAPLSGEEVKKSAATFLHYLTNSSK